MTLIKKGRILVLPNIKSSSGSGTRFSQIFYSGCVSAKTQNPAGVESGTSDAWPPLIYLFIYFTTILLQAVDWMVQYWAFKIQHE